MASARRYTSKTATTPPVTTAKAISSETMRTRREMRPSDNDPGFRGRKFTLVPKADRRVQQHSKPIAALHPLLTENLPIQTNAEGPRRFRRQMMRDRI